MRSAAAATCCAILALVAAASPAFARPARAPGNRAPVHAPPVIVALAPADDARRAVPIGPAGEVYEPDGKGAWVRHSRISTADRVVAASRAGGAIVAFGDGVIYRLAGNGWTALRLAQKGKSLLSVGARAIGAVGRQLYALDQAPGGEPAKLALAPTSVLAIGAGKTIVIQTDRGLFRVDGTKVSPLKKAPRRILRLVSDQWALVDRGVVDLRTGKVTAWPPGLAITVTRAGLDDRLLAVATTQTGLELVTLHKGKLAREPIALATPGSPVGVSVDRAGRAVIALRDGRLALRERGTWTTTEVRDEPPAPRPGAPPATSP